MAGYSAVSDVSNELVTRLGEGMVDPGPPEVTIIESDQVGLASPDDAGSFRLTVYLYQVTAFDQMQNGERRQIDVTRYRRPPLALELHYLITAHPAAAGNGQNEPNDPHLILGRAMQTLHDRPVLGRAEDGADGNGANGPPETEEAYVSISPRSIDEITSIWSTFENGSFRPSVSYLVAPVVIESTVEETVHRVVERRVGQSPAPEEGE